MRRTVILMDYFGAWLEERPVGSEVPKIGDVVEVADHRRKILSIKSDPFSVYVTTSRWEDGSEN
jgi:hypothetical protein